MILISQLKTGKRVWAIWLFSFGFMMLCHAQTNPARVDTTKIVMALAYKYYHGINCDVNLKKAKALYITAAKRKSSAAFNALGVMYLKGEGATQSYDTAYYLFVKAARMHNGNALCNMGLMFQRGTGVHQNFHKAYLLYKHAADSNFVKAYYLTGYMLYKGFGVKQDYTKAIEYFKKGDAKGDANCSYMMGCCNMYGYGVTQDFDNAKGYYTRALQRGHGWVEDIIETHAIDSVRRHPHLNPATLTDVKRHRLRADKILIHGNTLDADSLQGRWTGKLYTYDWSGTLIEKKEGMTLELQAANGQLSGKLTIDGTQAASFQALKAGKMWRVTQSDSLPAMKYTLKALLCKAEQQGDTALLTGNLVRFGKSTNEPMRPTCFILDKEPATAMQDTTFVIRRLYPNPFDNQLHVDFTVKESDNIAFGIHDAMGNSLYVLPATQYAPGDYSVTIDVSLHKGNYNFVATGQRFVWYENIIRK